MLALVADAIVGVRNALAKVFMRPVRQWISDIVRDVMIEFTVDDPNAGGPETCYKCEEETQYGVCPLCQPLAYARLQVNEQ